MRPSLLQKLDMRLAITNFAGLRLATPSTGDFIIDSPVPGFINAAAYRVSRPVGSSGGC